METDNTVWIGTFHLITDQFLLIALTFIGFNPVIIVR